jgi:hypothetical protein
VQELPPVVLLDPVVVSAVEPVVVGPSVVPDVGPVPPEPTLPLVEALVELPPDPEPLPEAALAEPVSAAEPPVGPVPALVEAPVLPPEGPPPPHAVAAKKTKSQKVRRGLLSMDMNIPGIWQHAFITFGCRGSPRWFRAACGFAGRSLVW